MISRRFSTVLRRSSFVLQSSTGKYLKPSFSIYSMYPWWFTFGFMYFFSLFVFLFFICYGLVVFHVSVIAVKIVEKGKGN